MGEHIIKHFDDDLKDIRSRVLQMGGLVEQQIAEAMRAFQECDLALAERVIANDREVNRLEAECDEQCNHIIALRQPAAVDLRVVMTVIRALTDLERIGDEAKKIAKKVRVLGPDDVPREERTRLGHLAELVLQMLHAALDAFSRFDLKAAADVVRRDVKVDAEFKGITRQIIGYMTEDSRMVAAGAQLLFLAKSLERIGDHAKNISQHVAYMAKGLDVRHAGAEAIDGEAER